MKPLHLEISALTLIFALGTAIEHAPKVAAAVAFENEAGARGDRAAVVAAQSPPADSYTIIVPRGLSSIANHLVKGSNTLAEIIASVPEGTILYKFDCGWSANQFQFGAWDDPTQTLAPGEGAFIFNLTNEFTLTFSGSKPANAAFPPLRRGFNLVSYPVPGESTLPAPEEGDAFYRFKPDGFDQNHYELGWGNGPPPTNLIGEAFFYRTLTSSNPPCSFGGEGGTVYFNNRVLAAGIDAPVCFNRNEDRNYGTNFLAQLWAGPDFNSLEPASVPVPFGTGIQAGYWLAGRNATVTLTNVAPGSKVWIIVRVWHRCNGATFREARESMSPLFWGESEPLLVTAGGVPDLSTGIPGIPADLVGLKSFCVFPPLSLPKLLFDVDAQADQPTNVVTVVGQAITFKAINYGFSVSVQRRSSENVWQEVATEIKEDNALFRFSATLPSVQAQDAGHYRMVASTSRDPSCQGFEIYSPTLVLSVISPTIIVPRGFSLIANHLVKGSNTVAEVLPTLPEGTMLYKFDCGWSANQFQFGSWDDPAQTLAPGEGAFIRNLTNEFTLTFSGSKPTNAAFPPLRRGFNLVSYPVPGESTLPAPEEGDRLHRFLPSLGYDINAYELGGWGNDPPPTNRIGEAFFYRAATSSNPPCSFGGGGGTVYFNNRVLAAGVDAPVCFYHENDRVSGTNFVAQLWAGPDSDSLRQASVPVPFGTGIRAGYWLAGRNATVTLTNVAPGSRAWIKVRVWNLCAGPTFSDAFVSSGPTFFGESEPLLVTTGGVPDPVTGIPGLPADLAGLQSFCVRGAISPPFEVVTGFLGVMATVGQPIRFTIRGRVDQARLQKRTVSGEWQDVPVTNEVSNNYLFMTTVANAQLADAGNYRVVGWPNYFNLGPCLDFETSSPIIHVDIVAPSPPADSYTITVPKGFSVIANHLVKGSNTVAEVLPTLPEGTMLYKFDCGWSVNQFQFGAWDDPAQTLAPGEGAFIINLTNEFTLTFSGSKPTNAAFPLLRRGFNLVSYPVPGESTLPAPEEGDVMHRFFPSPGVVYDFNAYELGEWSWPPPTNRIGEAFFYYRTLTSSNPPCSFGGEGGTVYFGNRVLAAGIDAPVCFYRNEDLNYGTNFVAQLWAGLGLNSLVPASVPVPLSLGTGVQGGYWPAGRNTTVTLTNVAPLSSVWIIVRVWNRCNGATFREARDNLSPLFWGESEPLLVTAGGDPFPGTGIPGFPANLVGLKSFCLYTPLSLPNFYEPTNVVAVVGQAITFEARYIGFAVDLQRRVSENVWQEVATAIKELPPFGGFSATLPNVQAQDAGHYRIVLRTSHDPSCQGVEVYSPTRVLSVVSPPRFPRPELRLGIDGFHLELSGDVGPDYLIEASTNFVDPWLVLRSIKLAPDYFIEASTNFVDWVHLTATTNFTGQFQILDRDAASFRQRFYRARLKD